VLLDESHVTTRPARGTDRAAIWGLVQELADSFTPEAHSFSTVFDASLDDRSTLVVVAETDERDLVGYLLAHLIPAFHVGTTICWVEEVMVAAQLRRSGVGRSLMSAAEIWADQNETAYVALATRRADEFYRAVGYEESATYYRKLLDPK